MARSGDAPVHPGLPHPLWHLLPEGSCPCLSDWGLSLPSL